MSGINYQTSDAVEKLSRYQTKTSQVYVKIFQQSTETEISVKKVMRYQKNCQKKNSRISLFFLLKKKFTQTKKNKTANKAKKKTCFNTKEHKRVYS